MFTKWVSNVRYVRFHRRYFGFGHALTLMKKRTALRSLIRHRRWRARVLLIARAWVRWSNISFKVGLMGLTYYNEDDTGGPMGIV